MPADDLAAADAEGAAADPTDDTTDAPADASARARDGRWLVVAIIVAIPLLVLVVALAQRTWYPTGDQAQAELRMRSLPGHIPLVGAAGRIVDDQGRQGNHPGPLMFWATWPLYVVLGRSSWAFEAATAIVNLAWLTVSVWLVKRRAGLAACTWYGIVALVLIGGFGLDALSQPWNPWVALLPFAVLLLATWSAIEGDRWAPVLAVLAASYALQGHIGYLPLVLPLCGLAIVAPIWRWWRLRRHVVQVDRASARRWAIPTVTAIGVALLAWSGPIVDVLTNDPNNVSKLLDNFRNPSDPPIGLHRGIEAVLQSSGPFGPWVWGGSAVTGSAWPGKVFLLVWAIVAIVVMRRGQQPALSRFNALLVAVLFVGTFAVTRIFGSLYLYTFRWIVVIVALQVFSLGWGVATLLPRPSPEWSRRFAAIGAVVLVGLSAVTAVRIARQDIPYDQSSRSEQGLAPQVAKQLDPDQRYLVTWSDPAYLGGIGFGLILDLERRGFTVGGEPQFDAALEPHRVMCPGDFDAQLIVVTGEHNIAAYEAKPGLEKIASVDPRKDRAAWDRAYTKLLAVRRTQGNDETPESLERKFNLLLLAPGQTQEVVDLAGDLVLGGVPSAVFLDTNTAAIDQAWTANANHARSSHPCPAPA